ncbi:MAG: hypothetical protein Q7R57_08290 [Dehalococcoidales bacterium]|nr:hypothetical protein [Dehalococcoidales bacterium]
MKTLIKKLYCSSCQRMVTGKEQKTNGTTKILCAKCSKVLWISNGIIWRSPKGDD